MMVFDCDFVFFVSEIEIEQNAFNSKQTQIGYVGGWCVCVCVGAYIAKRVEQRTRLL